MLAAEILDTSFFAGASFTPSAIESISSTAPLVSITQSVDDASPIPFFDIDLPTQYDPVAEKIGQSLFSTYEAAMSGGAILNGSSASLQNAADESGILVHADGKVAVEIVAANSVDELRTELQSIEFEERASFGKLISGSLDADLLDDLAAMESVNFVRPVYMPETNVGSVDNEADQAMRTDIARTAFGLDGAGIKIGVLSDSYDTNNDGGGAAGGIASGDLPGPGNPFGRTTPIEVLQESPTQGIDEGRAMLELIHDIVPEAPLAFRTANAGPVDFAQGILELASTGSDIIVDDITYFAQPFFQDGVIAQAAAQVVSQGVPFFSSAGNQGQESYDSPYRSNGAQAQIGQSVYEAHDFDPGAGVDNFQRIAVASGRRATVVLQWDQPFASAGGAGTANDLDIFVFDDNGIIISQSTNANIGGDAVEVINIDNTSNQPLLANLFIGRNITRGGPAPGRVKYYHARNPLTFDAFEFNTFSGTLFGHHQAAGGAGIAAADYRNTPEFGTNPAQPQPSTSRGGVPILFDTAGSRLSQPIVRQQPVLTGPDNTNTTFFSVGQDPDNDGNPNFAGTSAAAPHIAAVAALMMEAAGGPGSLSPQQINTVLSNTALDMLTPGFDFDTGAGFVNAEAAIAAVEQEPPPPEPSSANFYFTALVSGNQRELHESDGTSQGTGMVRNLAGSGSAAVDDLVMLDDSLVLFTARTSDGQRELHRSRGTSNSTFLVKNLAGSRAANPRDITVVGDTAYFSAALADGQRELYETKGTSSTTSVLRNLSGSRSSNPTDLTAVGDKLFFVATTPDGDRELHMSDGTAVGTVLVKDLFGTHSARPEDLTAAGNRLFFTALLPSGQRELFVSTGTNASTKQVKNLAGSASGNPANLTAVGSRLYFVATTETGERELHISSGSSTNTRLVKNLGGTRSASPTWLTAHGDELFFVSAMSNGQRELTKSDGTVAGTGIVRNLSGSLNSSPTQLVSVGDKIVFTARTTNSQRELHQSDGTSGGTGLVRNLAGSANSNPQELTAVGDLVAFTAADTSGQRELYISDLTSPGTQLVRNLNGSASSNPQNITNQGASSSAGNAANGSATNSDLLSNAAGLNGSAILSAQALAMDVNRDGKVAPSDALSVIIELERTASGEAIQSETMTDVNGDGKTSPADALYVIDYLSERANERSTVPLQSSLVDAALNEMDDEEEQGLGTTLLF